VALKSPLGPIRLPLRIDVEHDARQGRHLVSSAAVRAYAEHNTWAEALFLIIADHSAVTGVLLRPLGADSIASAAVDGKGQRAKAPRKEGLATGNRGRNRLKRCMLPLHE
jgi:hypothetical protein